MQERGLLDTIVGVLSSRVSMKLLRAVPRTVRGRAPACGLRPDCNAVTVAVESPEEKRGKNKINLTRPSASYGQHGKSARKQHLNGITGSNSKQLSNGYGSTAIPEPRSPRSRRLMRGTQLLAGSNRLLWRRT